MDRRSPQRKPVCRLTRPFGIQRAEASVDARAFVTDVTREETAATCSVPSDVLEDLRVLQPLCAVKSDRSHVPRLRSREVTCCSELTTRKTADCCVPSRLQAREGPWPHCRGPQLPMQLVLSRCTRRQNGPSLVSSVEPDTVTAALFGAPPVPQPASTSAPAQAPAIASTRGPGSPATRTRTAGPSCAGRAGTAAGYGRRSRSGPSRWRRRWRRAH